MSALSFEDVSKDTLLPCLTCQKSFKNLKRHSRIHSNEKPYKCETCSKSFNNHGSLFHHRKIHNPDNVPCNLCTKTFNSRILLKIHEKQHLNGIETTECTVCHKKIQSRSFKVHSYTHTDKKPFECPFCQKCFNNRGSLARHKKLHNTQTPFPCNICGRVYPSKSHLDVHLISHSTEKKEKYAKSKKEKKPTEHQLCNICFRFVKYLKPHVMRVHSSERSFICEHCSKSYKDDKDLKDHMKRKHSGTKEHQCKTCGKRFNVARVLKKHTETHTNGNVKCRICNKCLSSTDLLLKHQKLLSRLPPAEPGTADPETDCATSGTPCDEHSEC